MTALLPPNLLRLFRPRDPLPYLKPLTKDDADRGPDALSGISQLVTRLKEQAEADEIKQGLDDAPVTKEELTTAERAERAEKERERERREGAKRTGNGAGKEDVDMDGVKEEADGEKKKSGKGKAKVQPKKKTDKIARLGVVGQEARKMRLEERKKRKETYKKEQEKTCKWTRLYGTCFWSWSVTDL